MTQDSTDPSAVSEEASAPKARGFGRRKKADGAKSGKGGNKQPPTKVIVRPLAPPAKVESRHKGLLASFAGLVLLPVAAAAFYLYTMAQDQFASTVGFTVRSEEAASATDLLGGLGSALGGTGNNHDADILYEFVRSQELVRRIDARLDLRSLYSRHADADPLMSFDPEGTIEDLTSYWDRMLRISYDAGSGLMELRVLAFDPNEAKAIAEAVVDESSAMINALAAQAREDATRYAREDLGLAEERLIIAREALTAFRMRSQIVDPAADIQGQMGLLNTLQAQLAEALIDYDLLASTARSEDPRVSQAERRIEVIEERIAQEREKFGAVDQTNGGVTYATTIAEFERLAADREFAELSYTAARTAYDAALAEAARQSRYLAAYIQPTLAERSEFPQREVILAVVALFSFLIWAILSLVYYSLRDRR